MNEITKVNTKVGEKVITTETTREEIAKLTCDELWGICEELGLYPFRYGKKAELIDTVRAHVSWTKEEAEKKAKEEAIAVEKDNPFIKDVLTSIMTEVDRLVEKSETFLKNFQEQVASREPGGFRYALVDSFEDVLYHDALVGDLMNMSKFIEKEIVERSHSWAEIREILKGTESEYMGRCLESGFGHNSTRAADNINNQAEFKAVQKTAKVLRWVNKGIAKAIEKNDAREAGAYVSYI